MMSNATMTEPGDVYMHPGNQAIRIRNDNVKSQQRLQPPQFNLQLYRKVGEQQKLEAKQKPQEGTTPPVSTYRLVKSQLEITNSAVDPQKMAVRPEQLNPKKNRATDPRVQQQSASGDLTQMVQNMAAKQDYGTNQPYIRSGKAPGSELNAIKTAEKLQNKTMDSDNLNHAGRNDKNPNYISKTVDSKNDQYYATFSERPSDLQKVPQGFQVHDQGLQPYADQPPMVIVDPQVKIVRSDYSRNQSSGTKVISNGQTSASYLAEAKAPMKPR